MDNLNLNKLSEYSVAVWFNRIDKQALIRISKVFSEKEEKEFKKDVDEAVNEIKEMFNLK